jgi:hypothetical protein
MLLIDVDVDDVDFCGCGEASLRIVFYFYCLLRRYSSTFAGATVNLSIGGYAVIVIVYLLCMN